MDDTKLIEKSFSLCLPDGPPERLCAHCDVRGNGFPLAGLPGAVARYAEPRTLTKSIEKLLDDVDRRSLMRMIDEVEERSLKRELNALIDAVEDRKAMRELGRAGAFGRPGRPPRIPYSGKKASAKPPVPPSVFRDALAQMQWTLTGQLLLGDLQILPQGDEVPAGHYFPGTVERFDDSCGDNSYSRWNAFDVFTNGSSSAFQNIRCLDQGGNGAGWGSTGAYDQFTIKIRAGKDAVYWGPRTWAADWWATARHGVRVDRNVTGPGDLVSTYQEAQPGQSAAWSEAGPAAEYNTGWYPLRHARAVADASPYSDRGYGEARPSGGGKKPPLPGPPPRGTSEHKYSPTRGVAKWRYYGSAVEKLFHAASEIRDGAQAVYEALPKDVRDEANCKGVVCMVQTIAGNLDKLDWGKAVENLALNELQDRAVGGAHGMAQGGRSNAGNNLGLGQVKGGPFVPLNL